MATLEILVDSTKAVQGINKIESEIKDLEAQLVKAEAEAHKLNKAFKFGSKEARDARNAIKALKIELEAAQKEQTRLANSLTRTKTEIEKLQVATQTLAKTPITQLLKSFKDFSREIFVVKNELGDASTIAKQYTSILSESATVTGMATKRQFDLAVSYKASEAALTQIDASLMRYSAMLGEVAILEAGWTKIMQNRIAVQQVDVAIAKAKHTSSKAEIASIKIQTILQRDLSATRSASIMVSEGLIAANMEEIASTSLLNSRLTGLTVYETEAALAKALNAESSQVLIAVQNLEAANTAKLVTTKAELVFLSKAASVEKLKEIAIDETKLAIQRKIVSNTMAVIAEERISLILKAELTAADQAQLIVKQGLVVSIKAHAIELEILRMRTLGMTEAAIASALATTQVTQAVTVATEAGLRKAAVDQIIIGLENEHIAVLAKLDVLQNKVAITLQEKIALARAELAVAQAQTSSDKLRANTIMTVAIAEKKLNIETAKKALINAGIVSSDIKRIDVERLLAIALKKGTVEEVRNMVAKELSAIETKKATVATARYGKALLIVRGIMRGVAGAMGPLWMSYGSILPMMTAFIAAAAAIKSLTLGATFEYDTKYAYELSGGIEEAGISLEEFREQIQDLEGLRTSTVELAEGMKEFAKAGVSTATALKDIAEMSKFATVAEIGLADATKLVIGQANAFGISYSDAANKLSAAALGSATSIEEMAVSMQYTTELGSIAKVTFDEVAASLGILANAGIRQSKAGTALRTSIIRMQVPTKKLDKMLASLNIEWSAFLDDGKVKNIGRMFKELEKATKDLTDRDRIVLLKELFGLRSMKAGANVLANINKGYDEFLENVKKSSEGVTFLQKSYEKFTNTSKGQWELLKTAIVNTLVAVFDSAETTEFLRTFQEVVAKPKFAATIKLVASAVNDLLLVMGKLIETVLSIPTVALDLGLIGYALFGTNPIGKTIAGLIIGTKVLKEVSEETDKIFKAMNKDLKFGDENPALAIVVGMEDPFDLLIEESKVSWKGFLDWLLVETEITAKELEVSLKDTIWKMDEKGNFYDKDKKQIFDEGVSEFITQEQADRIIRVKEAVTDTDKALLALSDYMDKLADDALPAIEVLEIQIELVSARLAYEKEGTGVYAELQSQLQNMSMEYTILIDQAKGINTETDEYRYKLSLIYDEIYTITDAQRVWQKQIQQMNSDTEVLRNSEKDLAAAEKLLAEVGLTAREKKIRAIKEEYKANADNTDLMEESAANALRAYDIRVAAEAKEKAMKDTLKKATQELTKAEADYIKMLEKWDASIATKAMDARGKIMAKAIKEYDEMRDAIAKMKKSEKEYARLLAVGTDKLRKATQADLDAVAVAEKLKLATLKKSMALKDEEKAYSTLSASLKGINKLNAEYNEEMKKYERSSDYVKLLKKDVNAAEVAWTRHNKVVVESVYSVKNLIQAYKETGTVLEGFKAGLADIKEEMKELSEYSFEFAHDLRDATAASISAMLKSVTYGLRRAKNELKTVLDDSLEAATETYNEALVELEKSYASGELSTLEYEANKLDILENFNESKFDSQTEYNKSIKEAEAQLGMDIKDIWFGVLDSILEKAADWAADMIWTMGTNVAKGVVEAITKGTGSLADAMSNLAKGDIKGAAKSIGEMLTGKSGAMDVNVVSSVCCPTEALKEVKKSIDSASDANVDAIGATAAAAAVTYTFANMASSPGGVEAGTDIYAGAAKAGMATIDSFVDVAEAADKAGGSLDKMATSTEVADTAVSGWTVAGNAVGTAASAYGLYSGISSMSEDGINVGNAAGTAVSAYGLYNSGTALYESYAAYMAAKGGTAVATQAAAQGGAKVAQGASAGISAGTAAVSMAAAVAINAIIGNLTPSVEMFSTTLQSASGNMLDLTTFAYEESTAMARFSDPAWVKAQLDATQQYGTNVIGHGVNTPGYGMVDAPVSNTIMGAYEAGSIDTGMLAAETEGGSEQAAAVEAIADSLYSKLHDVYTAIQLDSEMYGDSLSTLALNMGESIPAFDQYVDAVIGSNVAIDASAQMMDLATQAATGNSDAHYQLQNALIAQGMSTEQATVTATQMAAVMLQEGAAAGSAAMSTLEAAYAIDDFGNTMGSVASDASSAMNTLSGYVSAASMKAEQVEAMGHAKGAIFDYHASGAIMSTPTVFHVAGDGAGSEVVAPLPYGPNMMADIYDATVGRESNAPPVIHNHFYVNGKEVSHEIMPDVDAHIVARNESGLTTERTKY